MNESTRREPSSLGAFVFGALIGAAVAYLTAKESGRETRVHIDDWLKDHGVDAHHVVDRLKKLLHVRTNGHGFVGSNGHSKTVRRHR